MICRGLRPRPQQECVTAMLCLRLGASSAFSFTRPERVTVSVPLDSREMMFELLMLDLPCQTVDRIMPIELRPRLYEELAAWWPLFSPPSAYDEEAADLLPRLLDAVDTPRTLLELGSGGGSLASHLKAALTLTLTDRSPAMLAVSRAVNPECGHIVGDMRRLDLGRTFDLVFVHDAIMYATTPEDVRATIATAHRHCRPGGAVIFVPDCVRETFVSATDHGGEDGPDGRGLRYISWASDPDPADDTYEVQYAFLLRDAGGAVHIESDRHVQGFFPRASWIEWLRQAGLSVKQQTDRWGREIFVARRGPSEEFGPSETGT